MTPQQLRLVGYLSWVEDEDLTAIELRFLARLQANPSLDLSPTEDRALHRLHAVKGY